MIMGVLVQKGAEDWYAKRFVTKPEGTLSPNSLINQKMRWEEYCPIEDESHGVVKMKILKMEWPAILSTAYTLWFWENPLD